MTGKVDGWWKKIFKGIFRSMLHWWFFAFYSGHRDWIVLILDGLKDLFTLRKFWQSFHRPLTHSPLNRPYSPVRIQVLSTLCDVISFNSQGQLSSLTCAEWRDLSNHTRMSTIQSRTPEKEAKTMWHWPENLHENLVPLLTYLSFHLILRS